MECMKIICIDYRLRKLVHSYRAFLFSLHACSLVMFDEKFCLSSPYSSTMQKVLLYHIVVSVIVEWSLAHCQQEHHKLTFAFGSFFSLFFYVFSIFTNLLHVKNLCSLPQLPNYSLPMQHQLGEYVYVVGERRAKRRVAEHIKIFFSTPTCLSDRFCMKFIGFS